MPAAEEHANVPFFDGPQVMKLGWDTANLVSADFDRDGRNDLALINNGQARLELLFQLEPGKKPTPSARPVSDSRWEPVLEDAPFQKASIVTGQTMHALAAADLNGDGRPDIAYTNNQGKLVLRFQAENQSWNEKREIEVGDTLPYGETLLATDINQDGRADLVLLTKKNLHLLIQGKPGSNFEHSRLPLADAETYGLRAADIDGDGRVDLLHSNGAQSEYLSLRRQLEDGSFSREELLYLGEEPRSIVNPIRFAENTESKTSGLGVIRVQENTGLLEISRIRTENDADGVGINLPLQRYAVPASSNKTSVFATGYFTGSEARLENAAPDVAVADGDGAQIWILPARPNGGYAAPISFPTWSGVNDLSALELDGVPSTSELLVVSQREKALGIMAREKPEEPLKYPEALPCRGTPLAAAVITDLSRLRIACVIEDKNKRELLIIERKGTEFEITGSTPLPEVNSKPRAVRVFDFNQDGLSDLLIFSADEPLRVMLQERDATAFTMFNDPQGLSGSLVDKLDPSAVTFADVDGDGKEEALIARKRFVRALRINAKNKVEIVAQFNASDDLADLTFGILLPAPDSNAPKKRPLLAYDMARGELLRAERDETGVYREKVTTPLKLRPNTGARLIGDRQLLLVGPNEVFTSQLGSTKSVLATVSSYESDLEKVVPQSVWVAHLNKSETPYVLLLDSTKTRVLEILRPPDEKSGSKGWESIMHFAVFNQDPHYRGKTGASEEPHDLLAVDVTADGKEDIVMLTHDRLLIYTSR